MKQGYPSFITYTYRLLRNHWRWLVLPGVAGVAFAATLPFYYRGNYESPSIGKPSVENIVIQPAPIRGAEGAVPKRQGILLVDNAHINNFLADDLDPFLGKIADRGFTIDFLTSTSRLAEKLEKADSFLVVAPSRGFEMEEAAMVKEFVGTGGKLLLLGDPTRSSRINTIAREFSIVFEPGFLYNVTEHDLNFQNIFIRDFRPDELTRGLERVVLYTAGSIRSSGTELALTDSNTFSSMIERTSRFSPIVKLEGGRVLAIADMTFLIPPHDSLWDNGLLVSNLADYLTRSEKPLFIE